MTVEALRDFLKEAYETTPNEAWQHFREVARTSATPEEVEHHSPRPKIEDGVVSVSLADLYTLLREAFETTADGAWELLCIACQPPVVALDGQQSLETNYGQ